MISFDRKNYSFKNPQLLDGAESQCRNPCFKKFPFFIGSRPTLPRKYVQGGTRTLYESFPRGINGDQCLVDCPINHSMIRRHRGRTSFPAYPYLRACINLLAGGSPLRFSRTIRLGLILDSDQTRLNKRTIATCTQLSDPFFFPSIRFSETSRILTKVFDKKED